MKTTFLLLLEKGYDKVLVSDIQNELGISRGLLYRYFKAKTNSYIRRARVFLQQVF
ncbi:MAG: helix-turn-helix domain-containing protein [Bacilli bacterium]